MSSQSHPASEGVAAAAAHVFVNAQIIRDMLNEDMYMDDIYVECVAKEGEDSENVVKYDV